jgi:serine protease Do
MFESTRLRHLPLLAVLAILSVTLIAGSVTAGTSPSDDVATVRELGNAIAGVAERARGAVVFIEVETKPRPARVPMQGYPFPFGPPQGRQPQGGQGTGFVVAADGVILTNAHVVKDAARITVRFDDGRTLRAKVVGSDPKSDVAVLRVEATDLAHLELANSDAIRVGEWVVAIGNPFGLTQTVTAGIVSAKGRDSVGIADFENFIQTDAAINPGNSGGPLLDLDGHVVGMNAAIYSRSGGYMGIGFAIPANLVNAIQTQLLASGHVTRGFLGVGIQALTPALAEAFEVGDAQGLLVTEVTPDGPAARAGVRTDDVLLTLDGRPVDGPGALRNAVALLTPGDEVELVLVRDGKRRTVPVVLGTREDDVEAPAEAVDDLSDLGFRAIPLDQDIAKRLDVKVGEGLLIAEVTPGSPAARAGLRPGQLLLSVDRRPVNDEAALRAALQEAEGTDALLLRIRDGRGARYVVLERE